jgi:hypothetical protein
MADFLEEIDKDLRGKYTTVMSHMEETPSGPQQTYLNLNHYFAMKQSDDAARESYAMQLRALYNVILHVSPGPREARLVPAMLPAGPAAEDEGQPERLNLNVWHFPLDARGYIRGETNSKQVAENMSALAGNKTDL